MKKVGCRPDVSGALIGDVFAIFPSVFTGALVTIFVIKGKGTE